MIKWRFIFIVSFLGLCLLGIITKLIYMQTVEYKFLDLQGDSRIERVINKHAFRGTIVDRNGYPIAVSTPVDAIWVNPRFVKINSDFLAVLGMLDLSIGSQEKILIRIKKRLGRSGFVYLKRQVNPYISNQIENMNLPGVNLQREYKRYYPDAEVTAHVLGFTNVDTQGQEGVELEYNNWLNGASGSELAWFDVKKNLIKKTGESKQAIEGSDIALSIDRRIQFIAYKALKDAVKENVAEGGSVIVLDVKTREILAMVNQPSYNPNDMTTALLAARRNRAVTDVFEPGSTIKTFAAIIGQTSGEYTPDSIINTSPGHYRIGRKTIRDFKNYGELSLRNILLKSSNVGISKLVLSLPHELLPDTLLSFGFGSKTGVNFPGERTGYVPTPAKWGEFPLATLSFGYGMNVTALQLANAYATIANDGVLLKPSLLKLNSSKKVTGFRIIDSEIAAATLDMLNNVVEGKGGTGRNANLKNYHVGGKTGTVRKAIAGGYATDSYVGVFVGVAPVTNPKLAVVAIID
ncbi:MAG: cell division protein FtsI (penicillin-binding protein 3), partial [Francisellaceae bacterium]